MGRPVAPVPDERPPSEALRAPSGAAVLGSIDPSATPGLSGSKAEGVKRIEKVAATLEDLQGRLLAGGRTGGSHRVLVLLQGMDTAGKSGAVKRLVGAMDPTGVRVKAFAAPTPEERRHDFLWRARPHLPEPGYVSIWDRSHYEDVVAAAVREGIDRATIEGRFDAVNRFEADLTGSGTILIKCFLHVSREEQRQRLLARLENPRKVWKWSDADLDDRAKWPAFIDAYETAIERCTSPAAPWYVIPADHKWYRDWALLRLLVDRLSELDLEWPKPAFDIEAARRRLLEE